MTNYNLHMVKRNVVITEDYVNNKVIIEYENVAASPNVPVNKSDKFSVVIDNQNGILSQAINSFLGTMQSFLPEPIVETSDEDSSSRISEAIKE